MFKFQLCHSLDKEKQLLLEFKNVTFVVHICKFDFWVEKNPSVRVHPELI